jgi:hypothetical protein
MLYIAIEILTKLDRYKEVVQWELAIKSYGN